MNARRIEQGELGTRPIDDTEDAMARGLRNGRDNGEVLAESAGAGKGATFTITLPAIEVP